MKRSAPVLAALLGLSACAGVSPAPVAPPQGGPVAGRPGEGVIVSARAVSAGRPVGGGVEGTILGAVGAPPTGAAGEAATEFIVRRDDGQTVSVVQAPATGLAPGRRVVLSTGARTRLVPAPD
jgi:hypothetical protein